jgi:hypothetical protein
MMMGFTDQTRIGATVSLKTHILPNFIYGYGSKFAIKDLKRAFAAIANDKKVLEEADKKVSIVGVTAALDSLFSHALKAEESIGRTDEDVFVLEFRAIELLKRFHDSFEKASKDKGLSPEAKAKLAEIAAHYKDLIAEISPKINNMEQEIRREKIERRMLKDFMIAELFAVYFQMRLKSNDLRRKSGALKSAEHRIVHELDTILKKPTPRTIQKVVSDFDKKFAPAIKAVIVDAIFIERMMVRLRERLDDMVATEKQEMKRLLNDGFPETDLEKINQGIIKKIESTHKKDLMKEYEEARAISHLLDQSKGLRIAA